MAKPPALNATLSKQMEQISPLGYVATPTVMEEERSSYGCYQTTLSQTFAPKTEEEVADILAMAHREGRNVTLCGANMSLDSQSLGSDISMTLAAFNQIKVDSKSQTVTAGVGANWGEVVDAVKEHNLYPYVVVSNRRVTVGGSISANSLSRFSNIHGREGTHVASLRMVTADGRILECSREQNADLFFGIIGGFGTLGVVLDVTHRLQPISVDTCIESQVFKCASFEGMEEDLVPVDPKEARYMVLSLSKGGVRRMSFRSRQAEHKKVDPIWLYKHVDLGRVLAETIAHIWMWLAHAIWTFGYFFHPRQNKKYVSEIVPYTFFTDGNVHAREWMKKLKLKFRMIEQTYIIPANSGKLELFTERLVDMCKERGIKPMLFDAMFLPEDEAFVMSSTNGLAGFAVNIAFEGLEGEQLQATKEMFSLLTTLCKEWGGRVHLVKNVFANPQDLRDMYADAFQSWKELKRKYDPQNTLGSGFIERIFDVERNTLS